MEEKHDGEAQERGGEGVVDVELHFQVRIVGRCIDIDVNFVGIGVGGFQGCRSRCLIIHSPQAKPILN